MPTAEITILMENDDNQAKLLQLIRTGLVDRAEVNRLVAAIRTADKDQNLTTGQKTSLLGLLNKLSNLVTSDPGIFQRAKSLV